MSRRNQKTGTQLIALAVALLLSSGLALAAKSKAAKVDLNTASQKELEDLPGVGEATAQKIIAGRPYSTVGDLEKAGIPKSTIDKIHKLVTVSKPTKAAAAEKPAAEKKEKAGKAEGKAEAQKAEAKAGKAESKPAAASASGPVNLNTASQKDLEALPGVGPATAKKIIAGRPYSSVNDLARAGVSKSTIAKIESLVTVGAAAAASKPSSATGSSSAPAASSQPAASSPAPASSAPAGKPAPTAAPASASKPASTAETVAPQPPPAKGMVWVNTATKVYHYEGDRWYGKTKEGKYMTEEEAIKAGYRASKEGPKKK